MNSRRQEGFTLVELVIALGIVAALSAIAFPRLDQWFVDQRVKAATRAAANALSLARSEAIRSGNNQIVFFQADALGNPLLDATGNTVPILILDDGPPGSPLQNCLIDAGERTIPVPPENGVNWGVTNAVGAAPGDFGGGAIPGGLSFTDPGGNPATWVLFRPEGLPLAFSPACVAGGVGTGSGGVYLTNGNRDQAVVVTPLGGVRTHLWNNAMAQWTN